MAMLFACGPIQFRTCAPMKKGQRVESHKHNFPHPTIIVSGAASITRTLNGRTETTRVRAGELPLLIEAGVEHTIEATEDNTVYFCAYPHRLPDGEIVDRYTGWENAYS